MRYALVVVLVCALAGLAVAGSGASSATQPVTSAPGDQESPAIAFTGASYVVAWKDARAQTESTRALRPQLPPPPPPPPPPPRADVFGARVSRAGRVLDASGIAIAKDAHQRAGPALASDGTNALVVWTDRQGSSAPGSVYGARITPAGVMLDRPGFSIHSAQGERASPVVAFDGANYLVVWESIVWPLGWFLDAARVTPSGTVLDPAAIRISSDLCVRRPQSLPAERTLWSSGLVRAAQSSALGSARRAPCSIQTRSRSRARRITHARRFTPTSRPVAFDGTNYLVAWSDSGSGNIFGTRVSLAGTVLDPGGIRISDGVGRTGKPTIAFGGTNYLVAWEDTRFGCCSIYGTRVSPAGSVLDPGGIAIATRGREQVEPTAAFDGTNYLVAWADNRSVVSSGSDIYGAHVTQDGRVLEARGILLSTVVQRKPRQARCVVPRVLGQRLAMARARIRRAHCSVGRIGRASSGRSGRVVAQSPRPGAKRRRGYPVGLVVGRR